MYKNPDFIKRVIGLRTLNFTISDFTGDSGIKYKTDIQNLFSNYYFNNSIDFEKISIGSVNKNELNTLIRRIKTKNLTKFNYIYRYPVTANRFGPGEILLYLLLKDAALGGFTNGVDIINGSEKYEVKAARISLNKISSNYNLGGKISRENELIVELSNLCKKYGIQGNSTSINTRTIDHLRNNYSSEFEPIESRYASTAASEYFKNDIIFINNNDNNDKGLIVSIKRPVASDIQIERVSEGRIKPAINLS